MFCENLEKFEILALRFLSFRMMTSERETLMSIFSKLI